MCKLANFKEKKVFIYLPPCNQIISLVGSIATETVALAQREFVPRSEREQTSGQAAAVQKI